MLITNTANPDSRPDCFDVEGELQTLEGLSAALKIVRYSNEASEAGPNPETQTALYTLIDTLVDQTAELRRVFDASLRAGANNRETNGEDDGENIVCVTVVGAAAEKLERLARHWRCPPYEAVRRMIADADREVRRGLMTGAEIEAYFGQGEDAVRAAGAVNRANGADA